MLSSITGLSKEAKGSIMVLGGAITGLGAVIQLVHKTSKAAAASNPWMAIAMAIVAVVNGIMMLFETPAQRLERLNEEADKLNTKAKEAKADYKTLDNTSKKLKELEEKRYDSAEATEEY